MKSRPNYYAIIPANVRYSEEIMANAKLLYGELTALCSQEGYCWASNAYFARLYGVSVRSVKKWLKSLRDAGFITYELEKSESDEVLVRKIYLTGCHQYSPREEKFPGWGIKVPEGREEKFPYNNTDNITYNTTATESKTTYKKTVKKATLEEIRAYVSEKRLGVDPQQFFDYFEAGDWHDSKGNPVLNWKQKLLTWAKHGNGQPAPAQRNTWIEPKPTDQAFLEELRREADDFLNGTESKRP